MLETISTVSCDACGKKETAKGIWGGASLKRSGWIEIRVDTKSQEDLFACSIPCAHKVLDSIKLLSR